VAPFVLPFAWQSKQATPWLGFRVIFAKVRELKARIEP
jgi:hypothetical protein